MLFNNSNSISNSLLLVLLLVLLRQGKNDEGETSKAASVSGDRDDLFFIDRVGEARPDVIDLCNTNDKMPHVPPPPSQPVKSDNIDALKEGEAENEAPPSQPVKSDNIDAKEGRHFNRRRRNRLSTRS